MLAYLFLSILPAALVVAAINDMMEMKIPNWVSFVLLASYPCAALYFQIPLPDVMASVLLALVVLAFGFTLFAFNLLGGGDAKLLAAVAPWMGLGAVAHFAMYMVLAGGALALALLLFRQIPPMPIYANTGWIMNLHNARGKMPYGVAIAVGGLLAMPRSVLFAGIL